MTDKLTTIKLADINKGDVLYWVPTNYGSGGWGVKAPLRMEVTKRTKTGRRITVFDAMTGEQVPDGNMPFPLRCYWIRGFNADNVLICDDPPINVQRTFEAAIEGAIQENKHAVDNLCDQIADHHKAEGRLAQLADRLNKGIIK